MSLKERSEIPRKYKWDVDQIYSSTGEWQKDFDRAKKKIDGLKKYEDRLMESPETFSEFMARYSETSILVDRLNVFASMRRDEDTRKEKFQALAAKADSLSTMLSSATSFVDVEIQEASEEDYNRIVESQETEKYRHFLETTRERKEHTKSRETENALSSLQDVLSSPEDFYSTFTNADLEFPEVEKDGERTRITQSNFTKLLKDSDREFRKKAYNKFYGRIAEFDNTLAQSLDKEVRSRTRLASIRNYDSSLEASLDRKDIPQKVLQDLIESVNSNKNVLQEHQSLKKEALGLEELKMYDLYVPLTDSNVEISFEKAKKHILEALKPLGDEYVDVARQGLESGWVDVYENKGKRPGAYSGGGYDTDPFILMNFKGDVQSMYTLIHELGHSMHSYFTRSEQPYIYSDYGIFLAEIASTVNEQLLTDHLLEAGDKALKRRALDYQLENFRNTLFRQALFAEFEKRIHDEVENGEVLTSERLNELYGELKEKYYQIPELDERIKKEWMRIPHFYYNFYVFQYATGISAAAKIKKAIISEGRKDDYIDFLRSGGSNYPLKTLDIMDIEANEHTFKEAMDQYGRYLDQAEELFLN
ncbi:MAG: oligoendopeptidase F [Candidatus Nanohaloarchaea archaeon]